MIFKGFYGFLVLVMASIQSNAEIQVENRIRLKQDEVSVRVIESEDGVSGIHAEFLVDTDRETIWAVLTDYPNFPKFLEGIEKVKVHSQTDQGATVEYWVKATPFNFQYVLNRKYDPPKYRLSWYRVSGDMKSIHGYWEIYDTEHPGQMHLVYESFVDIGSGVGRWAMQRASKKRTVTMADRLRAWVARNAE